MEIKELKNYGKSLLEMMGSVPQDLIKESSELSFKIIEKILGDARMKLFSSSLETEKNRMMEKNLSGLSEKGLNNEDFIGQQIEWAASFSAISKITDMKQAGRLFKEISETTYPKLFYSMYPPIEDLKKFNDPFDTFKEWFLVLMNSSRKIGAFDYDVVENKKDAFQVNCTWCAWHEIHKLLGLENACLPYCHVDDVFFPDYCRQIGVRFKRKNTLARGGTCCDYRFER